MQHALKHVERPGGSHTALDGKNLGDFLTPCGSVNLTEMVLEPPFRFLTLLQTSKMFVKPFDCLLRARTLLAQGGR